jgi:hypothetical protein
VAIASHEADARIINEFRSNNTKYIGFIEVIVANDANGITSG